MDDISTISALSNVKTDASQAKSGSQSYYYWHSDADRGRELGRAPPAPPPKHVLVKLQDQRVVVAGPREVQLDEFGEPWDDPPVPGGYILATPAERYTQQELFNWSKYISPPRGWPEAFTYFQPMKDFLGKRLKAQRVRLTEAPHPLEIERIEVTHGERLVQDKPEENAKMIRRLLGWQIIAGYVLLEEAQGCGRKDPVNSANYHGENHWWNATPRGVWVDFTPRRHKKLILVESAKVAVPPPTPEEEEAMKTPADRADEMSVVFVVDGLKLPAVRMTAKQLDGGSTFLAACLEAVEKPYKEYRAKMPASAADESDDDDSSDDDAVVVKKKVPTPKSFDKHALKGVLLDGKPAKNATSTPPREYLTKLSGHTIELTFFKSPKHIHFFRLFNLHMPRFMEASTLCFSRISKNAPPIVKSEWQSLANLIDEYGPLTATTELHLDGHGSGFGDATLSLITPLLASGKLPNLEVLMLQSSGLKGEGVRALADALSGEDVCKRLTKLDLCGNEEVDEEAWTVVKEAVGEKRVVTGKAWEHQGPVPRATVTGW